MAANAYFFVTRWELDATPEQVYRLLEDVYALAEWWPAVYLDVKELTKGQPGGVGKTVELYTKGWLPYTLRWKFRVTHTDFPKGFSLEALGDLTGKGIWHFHPLPEGRCEVVYEWSISAEKPLLRRLSGLLKPLFSFNHEWAMRKGEESIRLELLRRKALNDVIRARVPAPPGPTFPHNFLNNKIL